MNDIPSLATNAASSLRAFGDARAEGIAYRERQKKAFAIARRHSRLVIFLRAAIPAICFVAVIALIMFTFFNPFRKSVPVVTVSTVGISGTKVTMQLPKLSGYKKDLRSYNVTAETAVQDVKRPTIIELIKPDATIELEKQRYAHVLAATGVYDTSAEKMTMEGGVTVKTDTGYDIRMSDARADMKAGAIVTDKPVKVQMQNGTIEADTMEVLDSGKSIFFRGHVVTFFNAIDTDSAKKSAAETDSAPVDPAGAVKIDKKP